MGEHPNRHAVGWRTLGLVAGAASVVCLRLIRPLKRAERDLVLVALSDLRIERADDPMQIAEIDALVARLGGARGADGIAAYRLNGYWDDITAVS